MLKNLLELIVKKAKPLAKGAKIVGGGAIGSAALIALLISFVDAKEVALRQYIDSNDKIIVAQLTGSNNVVAAQVQGMKTQIKNVKTQVARSQGLILKAIEKLDKRVYNMAKGK